MDSCTIGIVMCIMALLMGVMRLGVGRLVIFAAEFGHLSEFGPVFDR